MSLLRKRWNKFFYINPKGALDSDSAWKQQSEQMKNNPVYDLVNFAGGGQLIDKYEEGRQNETVEEKKKRIKEFFEKEIKSEYLHDDCQTVTEKDYQTWHNNQSHFANKLMKAKVNVGFADNLAFEHEYNATNGYDNVSVATLDSVVHPFKDHLVKWRLDRRGAVGETAMHLLILNNSEMHTDIASAILELYPELALDLYEGFEYYGESCLHLAIILGNVKAVQVLLKTNQLDVHATARGKFFLPVDVKRGDVKLRKHRFEGYAYYGEYPLSFAASTGNHEIYDMLINCGCDPQKTDRFGNNVLHLTVIHNQPDMYYYAVKHSKKANPLLKNNDNLTPLALAAKLGRTEMFNKILDISSREFWSYNTVTCSVYPLESFDTIGPHGETNWDSALMMIVRGKKDSHLDMVSNEVVQQLLQEKWSKFGEYKFYRLLVAYLMHVLLLSIAVYLRPNVPSELRYGSQPSDIARYVFEALVVVLCALVVYYTVREIYLERLFGFWQNVGSIPSRFLYLLACVLTLSCIPFRFTGLYSVEDWILIFVVPGTWSYCLFFLRSKSYTGPLIIMIYKILSTDIVRFAIIFIIIWLTFGVAFSYQFQGQNVFAFFTPAGTLMTLFQMSFGEFSYEDVLQGRFPALAVILFVAFMILVHILLLNMLIAMMTRTFEKITKQSEKVWKRQWAAMVIVMERSHKDEEKLKFQQAYGINIKAERVSSEGAVISGKDIAKNVEFQDRGLMVIHHSLASKSQRRRNIQQRWKVSKSHLKQAKHELEFTRKKLQIHSIQGMKDFVLQSSDHDDSSVDDFDDNQEQDILLATSVSSSIRNTISQQGENNDSVPREVVV